MPVDHTLTATAGVEKFSGYDGSGQRAFGPAAEHKCRFEYVDIEIGEGQGVSHQKRRVVRVHAVAWFYPAADINDNDRVTIAGSNFRVVKKQRPPQIDGTSDHIEVFLTQEDY